MKMLNFLSRKRDSNKAKEEKNAKSTQNDQKDSFVLGVRDIFHLNKSDDLVVVGRVKGMVSIGDAVYCSNPGDDEGDIYLSIIQGIDIGPNKTAKSASNCDVGLKIENGRNTNIKPGTVLYTRDKSIAEVHSEYIDALGDTYVKNKNLVMTDEEIELCSLTDLAEIWRLFNWYHSEVKKDVSVRIQEENRKKINRIAAIMTQRILSAKEIFCVYNKATGEPHMFSRAVKQDNGYLCTLPDILIFTKAYESVMTDYYEKMGFEVKKINNGEKGDGIYSFLGSTFYFNGACGVAICSQYTAIDASMLVQKPDYSNIKNPAEIPITNPDVVRWLLLMGQLPETKTEDEQLIYSIYYRYLATEIVKGKFLVPMKKENDLSEPDENGIVVLKKNTTIEFPVMKGKYGRNVVCMYTDWKRFRMTYDENWSGLIQSIGEMITMNDCEINPLEYIKAGCYIGEEMYEEMKKLSEE